MQEFQGDADNKGAQGRAVAALRDDSNFFGRPPSPGRGRAGPRVA